ncbi:MAG: cupin [Elusimicrobiota bacterium]
MGECGENRLQRQSKIAVNVNMKIVKKPWGKETWFAHTKKYVGKFLFIKKGHRLSRQYHKIKHETIYTLKGKYIMELSCLAKSSLRSEKIMKEGSVIVIPPKKIHRMYAKFCDVTLLEVSTPEVWDVVRLEDDYGRTQIVADKKCR